MRLLRSSYRSAARRSRGCTRPGAAQMKQRSESDVRIVAFAYSCQPGLGSEPGAGWAWACMLAESADVWVVVRERSRPYIEEAIAAGGVSARLRVLYVEPPRWLTFWRRGHHGVRLHYLLWQISALRVARAAHRQNDFDLAWHLTFANAWIGSVASLMGLPFVYGPVGGGIGLRWRLLPTLGMWGVGFELARAAIRTSARYANPLARLSWRRARLIIGQNDDLVQWLPARHRQKAEILPHVALDESALLEPGVRAGTPVAVYAGRLVPLKGLAIAVRALEHLPEWRLILCGSGRDEARLRRLARRVGVANRIEFRGWMSRGDVQEVIRSEADVFLFPSYHDEAGWAVVEAMACDVPVVCLDIGGPPVLIGDTGCAVSADGCPREIAERLAGILHTNAWRSAHGVVQARAAAHTRTALELRVRDLVNEAVSRD